MPQKKMGEILIEKNVISQEILDKALEQQQTSRKPIGQILEDMDVVLEEDIAHVLSVQFGFPFIKRFSRHEFSTDLLSLIDPEMALVSLIFPLKIDQKTLYLAMANPLDMALQSDLAFKLNMRISPCVTTPEEIKTAIKKHYLPSERNQLSPHTKVVLLVDSHEVILNAAEAALTREGRSVYKARNGGEGLKIAAQLQPDLIITEIAMPRMDGIQMFNSLRNNPELMKIPVIALSSKATAEEESRLLDMGFDDFIAKPVNMIRLLARVRKALRKG